MNNWRQKHLWLLASFLLTFGIIFLLSYLHLQQGTSIFPLGMGSEFENIVVMTLSAMCIVRTAYEIIMYP